MITLSSVIHCATFRCSYFVCIWMKFSITRSAINLLAFFLITFSLWMDTAACLVMSFCSLWEVKNIVQQILRPARKSSLTTSCIKWYFCDQHLCSLHDVGLSEMLTSPAIFFSVLPRNANPKINIFLIFNPSQQARALYTTAIMNILKLNWLIFNNPVTL
jgi:hypothetical protein